MESRFEKVTVGEKVANFVTSIRTVLISIVVIFVVCILAFSISTIVVTKNNEKGLSAIDTISFNLTQNSSSLSDEELEARRVSALASISDYTAKGGVVGVRANMLNAEILYSQKKYSEAADSWVKAAEKGKKSYTAPLSYFNAASSYEDAGDIAKSEELYRKTLEYNDFDQIAHAKFSLGRVLESKENKEEAIAVYKELFDSVPSDSWAKLAKSRLIVLDAE